MIERVWRGRGEAVGRIVATEGITAALGPYEAHPALLDAAIQVVVCTLPAQATERDSGDVYLPVAIDQVRVLGRLAASLYSHARIVEKSAKSVVADVRVLDESGQTLVEIRGLRCRAIDQVEVTRDAGELVYAHRWQTRAAVGTQRRRADRPAGLPTPAEVVASTVPAARALVKEFGLESPSARQTEEMNGLCTAFLLEAFARLGVELQVQERFTAEELAVRLGPGRPLPAAADALPGDPRAGRRRVPRRGSVAGRPGRAATSGRSHLAGADGGPILRPTPS